MIEETSTFAYTLADTQRTIYGGIYDVPEAARYLRAVTVRTWPHPPRSSLLIRWIRRGLASPMLTHVPGWQLLLEFEDLISMRVITALRTAGVKWSEINKTEWWLRERRGIQRPFATEFFWTGQGELFVEWSRELVSGSREGQAALELVREFLIPVNDLVFDDSTHRAVSWEPVSGVALEPQVQYGAPCIKGTRIPTRTIFGMVEAGDPLEWVASAYGISSNQVQVAYDWESLVSGR